MASVDVIKTISPSGEEDDVLSINNTDAEEVSYTFGNILNFSGEYTFSCWMKSTSTNFDISVHISNVNHSFTITNEWQRIIYTGQANVAESKEVLFTIPSGFNLYAYQGQLEKGTIATDFAVNPQDLLSSIYDVDNKIVTLQTNFEVQQGQIDALIRDTTIDGTKLKDKFTQMQATVDGLNVTVGDVQSDVGTINSQMASLNLTVDGLTTEVSKAGTDAEEAKTLAQQTSDKFSWLVKSGTNETNFELTDRTAQLVADNINLKGLVKFEGLDSSAQDMITNGYKIGTGNPYQGEAYDYGIGIRKVKGKTVQQKTNGYQLFDTSKITNHNGITVTHEADGSFTLNGKAVDYYDSYIINTYGSTDIAITSGLKLKANVTNSNIRVIVGNGRETFRDLPLNTDIQDFNASNISWVVFRVNNNTSVDNLNLKIMLYQDGDGTWEQFTGGKPAPNPDYPMPIENVDISKIISHGRQLFDANKVDTATIGGATVTNNGDGSFTVTGSGNLTSAYSLANYYGYADFLKKGRLRLKGIPSTRTNPRVEIIGLSVKGNPNMENRLFTLSSNASVEITDEILSKVVDIVVVTYGSNGSAIVPGTIKPMIYQDGDGTWEPFKHAIVETSLTLAEGDTYENGQIKRVRKQITFDGSSDEGWALQSINDYGLANFRMSLSPISNENTRIVLSDRFKRQDSLIVNTTEEGIYLNEINQFFVRIDKNRLSTQDTQGFRNWLSTHNLVVEYELATPTTEALEIPTIPSYYPYTEVYIDSDVEPTDVEWNINTASNSALTIINSWTSDAIVNGTTTINGGYIKTQTITTDQLAVEDIFSTGSAVMNIINAQEINADRITSGTIKANFLELYGLSVLQKDTDRVTLGIDTEGNITMRGTVESYNYVAGESGWSIRNDGDAEFNDVVMRGNLIGNDSGVIGGKDDPEVPEVRFWAGASYAQRESAPFRVYSDGSVEATEGTYSGVWTGDIRVGNISIVDPSSISGGDAVFTIQDGQNGTKVVELTDADYSSFRQTLHIDNAYGDTMVSLSQGGSIVANTSISVGTTRKTIIDDDSITINGGTLTSNGSTLTIGASNIDIGNTNSTTPIDMNGDTTVNGVLKAMKEINYNDVLVCKTSTNGLDFSFLE